MPDTNDTRAKRPTVARRFTGVKIADTDQGPETGEVGRQRIERYAADRGWLNDKQEPDVSRMIRHLMNEGAKVEERARKRQARAEQPEPVAAAG